MWNSALWDYLLLSSAIKVAVFDPFTLRLLFDMYLFRTFYIRFMNLGAPIWKAISAYNCYLFHELAFFYQNIISSLFTIFFLKSTSSYTNTANSCYFLSSLFEEYLMLFIFSVHVLLDVRWVLDM
jgi:hypothetical protein